MWRLVGLGEAVDQALRILGLEGDDAGKLTLVVRGVGVEARRDKLRMILVFRDSKIMTYPDEPDEEARCPGTIFPGLAAV